MHIWIHFAMYINNTDTCFILNLMPNQGGIHKKEKASGPWSVESETWRENMWNVYPRFKPPNSRQRLVNKDAPYGCNTKGFLLPTHPKALEQSPLQFEVLPNFH